MKIGLSLCALRCVYIANFIYIFLFLNELDSTLVLKPLSLPYLSAIAKIHTTVRVAHKQGSTDEVLWIYSDPKINMWVLEL